MDRRAVLRTLAGIVPPGVAGCAGEDGAGSEGGGGGGDGGGPDDAAGLGEPPTLSAEGFEDGDAIPVRYTCEGEDVSPSLSVGDVPPAAGSLALVVDDPDAPGRTFTHWLLWALPPSTRDVPGAVPAGETVAALDGAVQGTNDAGRVGYSGPCPPPDDGPHAYRFRLLALAEPLDLRPGADRAAFDEAVAVVDHADAVLRGTFDR